MMITKITKLKLINKIHKKTGGAISKFMILDILNLVCDYIVENLEEDHDVAVNNFGIFTTKIIEPHLGNNVVTGELQTTKETKVIKFILHDTFKKMIESRKSKLRK